MGVRVRSGRVADGESGGQSCGLNRRLRRWLARAWRWLGELVAGVAARLGLDRYRKHFFAAQHALALVFHGLSGSACLLESYESLAASPGVAALAGLAPAGGPEGERLGVSYPNLMDANRGRPAAFLGGALPALVARVAALGGAGKAALPADLRVLDSTFLRLTLKLSPWLPTPSSPKGAPGVRVQVLYAPAGDAPEGALVTTKRLNDVLGMDALILDDPARLAELRGCTLVFDLGYYSHARFARLLAAGVHFVSRLKGDASLTVEAEVEVQAGLPGLDGGRVRVLRDARATVGSPNNRAGAVLAGLRLVEAEVAPTPAAARKGAKPVVYRLLTDRADLGAHEVVRAYLWRWQIELFFRWLKSHVRLLPALGHSRNAVELTVYLTLLVHLLTALAARAFDFPDHSPRLLARLRKLHDQLSSADLDPEPRPVQLAFSGWQPLAQAPP
jgi:Transposase DDE domain